MQLAFHVLWFLVIPRNSRYSALEIRKMEIAKQILRIADDSKEPRGIMSYDKTWNTNCKVYN